MVVTKYWVYMFFQHIGYLKLKILFTGSQMNTFLNENWSDVIKEVGPGISKILESVITSIIKGYLENVPYDEIFLD